LIPEYRGIVASGGVGESMKVNYNEGNSPRDKLYLSEQLNIAKVYKWFDLCQKNTTRDQYWADMVTKFQATTLSQAAFCLEQDLVS